MKIVLDALRSWVDLPADDTLRGLFDDVGLEVKRAHTTPLGLVFTLELLANRGDHRCYAGVARELATRLDTGLRLPAVPGLEVGPSPHPLRIETDRCLRYALTLLEKVGPVTPITSPLLAAEDLATGSAPVDASNLALLELGQPTHCFDADTVVGPVTVRISRPGETAWPLFQSKPVEVPANTLVIADDVKILAIAGVIGCEESKTTADTRRVLLESATFEPTGVRIAARALGLSTDASQRFERGADPDAVLTGAGRVVALLEATGGWVRRGPTGVDGAWTDPNRLIHLDLSRANTFLGTGLDASGAARILGSYGFRCVEVPGGLDVRVPAARLWDVETPADLHEELARGLSYQALPTRLPPIDRGALASQAELRRERVEEVLLAEGFQEIVTNGFYSRQLIEGLGIGAGHPLADHVETTNALDRGYSLLKNNGLAQAVETVLVNTRLKHPEVRAFEWTRVFLPTGTAALSPRRSPATERSILWAVVAGPVRPDHWGDHPRPVDLWYVMGLVEAVASELKLPLRFGAPDLAAPLHGLLHPHRQGRVLLDGRCVGTFGEVHPAAVAGLKLKASAYYLELDGALLDEAERPLRFVEPPAMPPMNRQLTLVLPTGLPAGTVTEALRAAAPDWVEDLRVTDLFDLDGGRALTWNLQCVATRERTADDVNRLALELVAAVEAKIPGVKLRV